MRLSACFALNVLILLAGCAAPRPLPRPPVAAAQQAAYAAKVLAVRPVSGGLALGQVMQTLGEPGGGQQTAQEVVIQLPDGTVKSVVPPPGAATAALAPGAQVLIIEAPQLRITPR